MFWRITLPLLNPVIVYLAVLQTIDFLRMFDLVLNMTNGSPLNSTTTVVLEVYNEGFSSYNMGYAAALTVILFALILLITILQLRATPARGVLTMTISTDSSAGQRLEIAERLVSKPACLFPLHMGDAADLSAARRGRS